MSSIYLAISDLRIGHYIHLPIGWTSHPFMLNSFLVKDDKQLHILNNINLDEIMVDVELSEFKEFRSGDDISEAEKKAQHAQAIKNKSDQEAQAIQQAKFDRQQEITDQQDEWWKIIRTARKEHLNALSQLQDIYSKLALQPDNAVQALELLSANLVSRAYEAEKYQLVLCNAPIGGDLLYQNALNVAIISCRLAMALNFERKECNAITQIALLSNYGLLWVPESIRNKKTALTTPEQNYLKQHPAYAQQKLKDIKKLPELVKQSILQSNERLDGSGFPRGLTGNKITEQALLVSLVSRYNSTCNHAVPEQKHSPHLAIALLFKLANKQYSKTHIEQLIKSLSLFPVGTLVSYNNDTAQVQMTVKDGVKQPFLMSFTEIDDKKRPLLIDTQITPITALKTMNVDDLAPALLAPHNIPGQLNFFLA